MAGWLEHIVNIIELYVFEIFMFLIIFLFSYYMIKYHLLKLMPLKKGLSQFYQFLTELDNTAESKESAIDAYISKNTGLSFLSQAWMDYITYRSVEPDILMYFDNKTLIDEPASRSRASSVSSSLMTMGLLMSFFYLIISNMDSMAALTSQGTLAIVVSKVVVLGVVSIITSSIYNGIDKFLFENASKEVYKIQRMLKLKLAKPQQNSQLDNIALSIDNMTSSLAAFAQYTADIQRDGMNQLVDSFLNCLNHEMNDQLTAFGKSLQDFSEAHYQSAVQTEALVSKLIKGTENQIYINQATEQIIQSVAQYQEQISSSSQSLAGSLHDLQELSEALSGIVSFNSEALAAIKQEREDLTREYSKSIQGFQDMIKQYQKESSVEIDKLMNKFTDASIKTFDRLEGSVMKSMDVWINSNKSMIQNMEEKSRGLISVSREIALRLNELNSSLRDTIKEFTQAVETGSVNTLTEFDKGLGEITQRLSQTITEIRDSIDDLPVVIESLKKHLS